MSISEDMNRADKLTKFNADLATIHIGGTRLTHFVLSLFDVEAPSKK